MVYLLKRVIFHGELLNNQMVGGGWMHCIFLILGVYLIIGQVVSPTFCTWFLWCQTATQIFKSKNRAWFGHEFKLNRGKPSVFHIFFGMFTKVNINNL